MVSDPNKKQTCKREVIPPVQPSGERGGYPVQQRHDKAKKKKET